MRKITITLDENNDITINDILTEEELLDLADSFGQKIYEIHAWDYAYSYILKKFDDNLIQNNRLLYAIHTLFVKEYNEDESFDIDSFIDSLHYLITENLIPVTDDRDYIDTIAQASPYAFSEIIKCYVLDE